MCKTRPGASNTQEGEELSLSAAAHRPAVVGSRAIHTEHKGGQITFQAGCVLMCRCEATKMIAWGTGSYLEGNVAGLHV